MIRHHGESTKLVPRKNVPKILILGAGVAGVRAALTLEELSQRGELEIVVIDEKAYHLLIPNLHEAATSRISTKAVQIPLEQIFRNKDITFHRAKVSKIDFEKKFALASGSRISYDFLIIALGGRANFYNIPGLMESAFSLRSLEDAIAIRTHVLEMFELAVQGRDAKKRKELLTFVVGGVGAAGTQLVTELADWIRELKERYGVHQDDIRIIAVEALETMGIDQPLVRYAYKILKEKGIKLILGAAIQSVDKQTIVLSNGKRIHARTLVWTGGIRGNELIERSGLRVNHQGRARVNQFLETEGHEGMYVIGDASTVIDPETGRDVIPSAQMAINEATYVAEHLIAKIHKLQMHEYRLHRRGIAISLGRKDGASLLGNIRLLGKIGKFFKTFSEIRYFYLLGGLRQIVQGFRRRSQKAVLTQ
ncbi:MAG: NAD(P)/FAD-dependent oxidoreductase [Candidatus Heimdallarchaeota archaeon]